MTDDRPSPPPGEGFDPPTVDPSGAPSGPPTAPPSGPPPGGSGYAAGPPPSGAPPFGPPPFGPPPEPPPLTAFAWRHGLVRPAQGRLFAGVCGALGRATNTDPVLWRVVIAVLTVFGGIGVFVYLIGWLLLPADGDTASPVEALLGRGSSATSSVLTIIGGLIVVLSLGAALAAPFRPGILGGVVLGGAVLLVLRDQRRNRTAPAPMYAAADPASAYPGAAPVSAPAPAGAMPTAPGYTAPGYTAPGYTAPPAFTAPAASGPGYSGPTYAPPPPPYAPQPGYGPQPYGTQAPFAPRGPFVPAGPPPPPPPVGPPRFAPRPPRPPKPRSRLGGLTVSLALVVLGGLYLVGQAGHGIPVPGYLAAALATVGLGLVIGGWFGRARGLIALGIVLVFALASASAAGAIGRGPMHTGTRTIAPSAVSQVESSYGQDVGDLVLDLSNVDFNNQDLSIDARVDLGNLRIIVGPTVDVVVDASVDVGNAAVFGDSWNGLGLDPRTVTDVGSDGTGGGKLHINARVSAGNLEVHR